MKILLTFRPKFIGHLRPEEDLQAGTRELCILHTCFSHLRSPLFIRIMLPACLKHSVVQCGTVCWSWSLGQEGRGTGWARHTDHALTGCVDLSTNGHMLGPAAGRFHV